MKYFNFIVIMFFCFLSACKKMEYFQTNPNSPTTADPALLLTNLQRIAFGTISADAALASRYLDYTQGTAASQYYNWNRSNMSYENVSQAVKMQQEAARTGKLNYRYLSKFFQSVFIINMTQTFGDIPYSQMMQSLLHNNFSDDAVLRPVYDKQRDIYIGVLAELKIASDSLSAAGGSLEGDIVYNGDITKWKQLINSFTLRVLISLSKKENDAELAIKQRFNEIAADANKYPLMKSNADNGQLAYFNITGNQYPYYNNNSMKTDYYLDSSFVDILKQLKDPRLFVYGTPMAQHLPVKDFNSYDGLVGSAPLAYNTAKKGLSKASQINRRYAYEIINEPSLFLGYSEVQFLLAEAVIRGWISGDAATYYKNGIKAAMEFSNFNYIAQQGSVYAGQQYAAEDIAAYLAQPAVALSEGGALEQIITQKYISMFMNTGWQPFYEQRRTGFPEFEVNGSGIVNKVNGINAVPRRWMYPSNEVNNNGSNLQKAISDQFPEGDNVNGIMWLLQ